MKKTYYFVDKCWYSEEHKRLVGDMDYSFCDMGDTITDDFDELKSSLIDYADFEIDEAKESGTDYLGENEDFPIYSIIKASYSPEDDDDTPCVSDLLEGKTETLFVCAYCTSERAEKIKEFMELECDYFAGDFYHKEKKK